jgi:perosamine synthetase
MVELGFNYRISDLQCALGRSQLKKLPEWLERRAQIAGRYQSAFADSERIRPLAVSPDVEHAWHLYVVRLNQSITRCQRDAVFQRLREAGVGVNVHYVPVHLHPFYQERFGYGPGLCPVAEEAFKGILSLPMFAALPERELDATICAVLSATSERP